MAEMMDFDQEIKEEVMADIEELLGKRNPQFSFMEFVDIKREVPVYSEGHLANGDLGNVTNKLSVNNDNQNEIKEEVLSDHETNNLNINRETEIEIKEEVLSDNETSKTNSADAFTERNVNIEDIKQEEDEYDDDIIQIDDTSDEGESSDAEESTVGDTDRIGKIHGCRICSESFNTEKKLRKHLRKYHAITRKSALKAFHFIKDPAEDTDKSFEEENFNELTKTDSAVDSLNDSKNSVGASMKLPHINMGLKDAKQSAESKKDPKFMMYECEVCLRLFKSKRSLVRHSKTHAEVELALKTVVKTEPVESEDVNQNNNFLNMTFGNMGNFNINDGKKYVCDFCGARFTKLNNKKAHMKLHAGLKPHKCSICPSAFSQKSTLKAHMAMHSGEKRYKCSYCQVAFTTNTLLKKHEMMHRGEKPLTCEICNLKFLTEKGYKTHLNKHNNRKQFKCEICGAGFLKGLSYLQHMKRGIHNGDTEYKCPYCDIELTTKKRFENHIRKHAEPEVKDKCDICFAEFRNKGSLANHLKIHIQAEIFRCDVCDATFTQKYQLTVHQRVHSGEVLFKCEQCRMTFYTKAAQSFHMKFHHGYRG